MTVETVVDVTSTMLTVQIVDALIQMEVELEQPAHKQLQLVQPALLQLQQVPQWFLSVSPTLFK